MARQVRSDCKVSTLEKKLGIPNCIMNPNGRNARGDKTVGALRKDYSKKK